MSSNIALTGLARDLALRSETGRPVRLGVVGCGEMGTDIAVRTAMMDGIEVAAIVDHTPANGHAATALAKGRSDCSIDVSSSDELNSAIETGRTGVLEHIEPVVQSGLIDVIVDATGVPDVGAEVGMMVLSHGKHLVMMNVEADVTVGAVLRREADHNGVVYTLGAGDEPSACMELIEFISAMGHKIVCAGKGKNNPLNVDAEPEAYREEAERRNMNPRMLVEFVEGSKTMVEMAAIANASGLIPDCDGMHGPAAGPDELASTLIPQSAGGVLSDIGRVDFSVGKGVAPGVFVIAEAEHPRVLERLRDLKVGEGPYFSFMRPFHLTSLEVPLTCARAVLYGKSDMAPLDRPTARVCALAKRDLHDGSILGQLGESDYRAWIMEETRAHSKRALPAGLCPGAKVTGRIRKGELITCSNAEFDHKSPIVSLRRSQDQLIYGSHSDLFGTGSSGVRQS